MAALALAVGHLTGRGLGLYLLVVAALVLGLQAGLNNWRRSLYWLLACLPFAGIAAVVLYPRTAPALLAKDFLFVIPAYVGFLVGRRGAERVSPFGGATMWLMIGFSLLVIVQAFDPSLPSGLVAATGVKVWLFYIPLIILGYHMVCDRQDLHRLLQVMSVVAVVPALVGIIEALLIYSGRAAIVYGLYGDAAASVTQDFAEFNLAGGGMLRRVPSTFAFVAQYFSFTVAMTAVAYAWWRGAPSRRWSAMRCCIWLLLLLAGFLSGARAAFLFLPFLMGLIVLLEGRAARFAFARLAAPAVLLLGLTVAILGTTASGVLGHAIETGAEEFGEVFVNGFRLGLEATRVGLGTGADTNAARHAFGQTDSFMGVGGTWYESWYVKAHLELGVAGLVLLVLLLGALAARALMQHRRLRDPRLRVVSASLIGLLIWNLVFNVKAQYLDIDPMNVYFWLLLGLLLKLPVLDAPADLHAGEPDE